MLQSSVSGIGKRDLIYLRMQLIQPNGSWNNGAPPHLMMPFWSTHIWPHTRMHVCPKTTFRAVWVAYQICFCLGVKRSPNSQLKSEGLTNVFTF